MKPSSSKKNAASATLLSAATPPPSSTTKREIGDSNNNNNLLVTPKKSGAALVAAADAESPAATLKRRPASASAVPTVTSTLTTKTKHTHNTVPASTTKTTMITRRSANGKRFPQQPVENNFVIQTENDHNNDDDEDESMPKRKDLLEYLQIHQRNDDLYTKQQELLSFTDQLGQIPKYNIYDDDGNIICYEENQNQKNSNNKHDGADADDLVGEKMVTPDSKSNQLATSVFAPTVLLATSANNNNTTNSIVTANSDSTATLVQQKLTSAKDRFFAHARDQMRARQVQNEGVFGTTATINNNNPSNLFNNNNNNKNSNSTSTATGIQLHNAANMSRREQLLHGRGQAWSTTNKDNNHNNNDAMEVSTSALTTRSGVSGFSTTLIDDPHRRAALVRNIVATSSVFNVDSSAGDVMHHYRRDGDDPSNPQKDETMLTFAGFQGKRTQLAIFAADSEPTVSHIDKLRENALLAALEAGRSRTANETRQADAASALTSFFRMVVVRRRYLRQQLNIAKQLRTIDRLRCCKAAMMLSRFCRGHNVRKAYRVQRAEVAAKRLDNLTRRAKIERPATPGLQRVPPTDLLQGTNCTAEEWTLDVLARYNANFVNGVRAMMEGNNIEAVIFFDAHIKTSTVSSKEQSNEYLAELLLRKVNNLLPAHIAQELLLKQTKGRRRF